MTQPQIDSDESKNIQPFHRVDAVESQEKSVIKDQEAARKQRVTKYKKIGKKVAENINKSENGGRVIRYLKLQKTNIGDIVTYYEKNTKEADEFYQSIADQINSKKRPVLKKIIKYHSEKTYKRELLFLENILKKLEEKVPPNNKRISSRIDSDPKFIILNNARENTTKAWSVIQEIQQYISVNAISPSQQFAKNRTKLEDALNQITENINKAFKDRSNIAEEEVNSLLKKAQDNLEKIENLKNEITLVSTEEIDINPPKKTELDNKLTKLNEYDRKIKNSITFLNYIYDQSEDEIKKTIQTWSDNIQKAQNLIKELKDFGTNLTGADKTTFDTRLYDKTFDLTHAINNATNTLNTVKNK